jgi:hypothetical protein
MRRNLLLGFLAAILVAALAEAGSQPIGPVPTLGEAGVVMLALGLVGGGIAALRRDRKR